MFPSDAEVIWECLSVYDYDLMLSLKVRPAVKIKANNFSYKSNYKAERATTSPTYSNASARSDPQINPNL